ncbi:MAG: hypothetical protein ACI80M_000236 [Gammaproteobacteria bacterium]|jgi:hypothetical protein|tara:strand:- start:2174 stop:2395 length:222 start_codon:yes stop_codon:yes gene_type:complete
MKQPEHIPLGRYRHYKGQDYSVVGFARHSETEETMVLYVPLYGKGGYWVRPLSMFIETVTVDGVEQPRFQFTE